jgi:Zn-dependent peptidase ImmA (M78 family)
VQLATEVGISQAALSKVESGEARLDLETWRKVAKELLVPLSAFRAVQSSTAPARIFHRKQRTTPSSAVNKVAAELSLVRLRVRDLIGDQATTLRRHDLEDGFNTPQEVARNVRDELGLGREPLDDLVATLEEAGVLVLRWSLDTIQVDAIASWQDDSVPVILIGEHVPADRQRFTMAHELGHAVMHEGEADKEQEAEADAFAAEFLAPASEIAKEWPTGSDLDALLLLKKRWGISLSALIRRGKDTGRLTDQEYRQWNIQLSTTGMHRREPDPGKRENPTALTKAIRKSLDEGASVEELARSAHMYPREFQLTFIEEPS